METKTKKKVTFAKWNPAEYINSKEDIIALLEFALEENKIDFLLSIIGDMSRSKGMTKLAKELNIDRTSLYKSLVPDGNPSFKTVLKLLDILGLQVRLEQKSA